MIHGPVGAPYPGKYVMYAFVAFIIWHMSYAATHAMRHGKELRDQRSQGIVLKPDAKKNPNAGIGLVLFDLVLLFAAVSAIYYKWPN
jgi:hypothetical protein